MYRIVGWGCPIVITAAWAVVTAFYYHSEKCWWGYNLSSFFWIIEGPRMIVVFFNFLFLLNIIRTLVEKLRQSRTSEMEKARKSIRAMLVLLPLLGITNLLSMTKAPLDRTIWEFALWSYATQFLKSFQGLFIATIYCFLNGEVKLAISKTISTYMSIRKVNNDIRKHKAIGYQQQTIQSDTENQLDTRRNTWYSFFFRRERSASAEESNEYVLRR